MDNREDCEEGEGIGGCGEREERGRNDNLWPCVRLVAGTEEVEGEECTERGGVASSPLLLVLFAKGKQSQITKRK